MENGAPAESLPRPRRERWQPLRSGFVNLYRYDREEFHYENGRLLLRGNNGTGKSRVLALQLPFLLDGEVIPQRMEPDADPAKRAEWNLLMGRYPERTGYTWIEFGRLGQDGNEHYLTLGCGLSALEGKSGVRKWFFTSTQRMGIDLEVVGDGKQVLGKDRLRERIGNAGEVFESAAAYRRAVNEALFRLDDYRYASFVNLLIQLRRPQLTRRLDEDELAGALSEALPPVSTAVIAGVAEAFRKLESDRNTLEYFNVTLNAVDKFLKEYKAYAKAAAKRRVDRVRQAHYEYEGGMKEILLSETDYDRSLADLAALKNEIQRLSADQHALQAEIAALEQSPESRDARVVEHAQREALEKRKLADGAAAELADAEQVRKARAEEYMRCKGVLEQRQARLDTAKEAALETALSAGLDNEHQEFLGSIDAGAGRSLEDVSLKQAREKIEIAIQTQAEKAEHLRRLQGKLVSSRSELNHDIARRDQLAGLLDDARERLNAAQQEHQSAGTAFLETVRNWCYGQTQFRLPLDDGLSAALAAWCDNPQSSSPLHLAAQKAIEQATRSYRQQRAENQVLQNSLSDQLDQLGRQLSQLSADPLQAVGRSREGHQQSDRPGAPLWTLCDFVDGLDTATRGRIEAALEASGLLNAWVSPSGEFVDPDNQQAVFAVASGPLPPEGAHLGNVLEPLRNVPDDQSPVPSYVLADILRHIGTKPNLEHTWISPSGLWQNGLLHGDAFKPAPEYIGEAAREAAANQRILELEAAIAEAESRLDALAASCEELEGREQGARNEADAAPLGESVRAAYIRTAAVAGEVDALTSRLAELERQIEAKQSLLNEAIENHDRTVADLGIARWADDLSSFENGISNYGLALSSFWHVLESVFDARIMSERAWTHVEEAGAREGRQKEVAEQMERSASAAKIELDTLMQAAGSDLGQALHRLDQARRQLDDLRAQDKEAQRRYRDTELKVTRVDERLRNLTEMLNGQTERRDSAASQMRAFATTRLLHLADPRIADEDALTWSTTRAVEVAFELGSKLDHAESSDSAWEHYQKSVPAKFNELMQTLSAHGCQPSATFREDVFVATARFGGRECSMEELHKSLLEEVSARRLLLDAREREILENDLVGEVSTHLHDVLHAAEEQVRQMNLELDNRPMSTGMKLRFVWRPAEDGPAELAEVRERLMQSSDTWSLAERQMLGAFLQQQIQAISSQMESGRWPEALAEALDYRKWHRFGVERYQDGVWRRLTRRTHGTGSGGEKAVALTLPHFAAAAAFYRTADPFAPRLILLDEAFVGIDADMRAKCMGLIHAFDLDFIMTSEREWGCYPTLPGLAIYQLSTRPDIDAIGLTRWVWDGQHRMLERNLADAEDAARVTAGEN